MHLQFPILAICLAVSSCSAFSLPKVNETTGLYVVEKTVDRDSIKTRVTNVDLKKYRFVWIVTHSENLPQRLEFLGREALAQSGFKHVLDTRELTNLVIATPQLSGIELKDSASQRRLAELVGPIAVVDLTEAGASVGIRVSDLTTGKTLLAARYWDELSLGNQRIYPVLNELIKWAGDCDATKERT